MKKKILVTGASGFLGGYLVKELSKDHEIFTLGRTGTGEANFIEADLKSPFSIGDIEFDIVVHAAGKAHVVPRSEEEEKDFFLTNVEGTRNLLKALEEGNKLPASLVFISTVSVYGVEEGDDIEESAPLLSTSPYGQSKIEAEELIRIWCLENKVKATILRLPLIAGKNPPGNLGSMIEAIKKKRFFIIGDGSARKSMVLAEDVAKIIPGAAETGGIFNLTDGHHPSFKELSGTIWKLYHGTNIFSLPKIVVRVASLTGDLLILTGRKNFPLNSTSYKKMTRSLTFNDEKARNFLGWEPGKIMDKINEIVNPK